MAETCTDQHPGGQRTQGLGLGFKGLGFKDIKGFSGFGFRF